MQDNRPPRDPFDRLRVISSSLSLRAEGLSPSKDDELNSSGPQPRTIEDVSLRNKSLQRRQNRLKLQTNRSFTPTGQPQSAGDKSKKREMPAFWYKLGFLGKFFCILGLFLVLGGASAAVYFNFIDQSRGSTQISKAPVQKSKTVPSPLTGMQVAPELAGRPVTAIMIENSLDARPQSGIDQAGVVFEAIAEGGITRFITLYQETQPTYVGPVRSLRPYYIDWAVPFDASIAHIGGSPEALAQIRNGGKDLDQFFNPGTYWRQNSRPAPHNVYTGFEQLNALNSAKGYSSSKFVSWLRKADKPLAVPIAKTIDMPISSSAFYIHYDYHASDNSYGRSEGGAPHMATNSAKDTTGQQIHPKVVIVLVMGYGIEFDGLHGAYDTYGSGSAYVFQDGGVTQGTWTKADRNAQFDFKDLAGNLIKLNAGQTWITMVSSGQMSYAP
ncbi:DUF3048 domain-containing protein [Candidatus Saccharibacteria bacterium]|nr:DUF3048 domain-containing protein [Candidatus Saccharibacteria bacterium]